MDRSRSVHRQQPVAPQAQRSEPRFPSPPGLCLLPVQDIFNLLPNLNVAELSQSFAVRRGSGRCSAQRKAVTRHALAAPLALRAGCLQAWLTCARCLCCPPPPLPPGRGRWSRTT